MRRIKVEVGSAAGNAELLDEVAPETAAAIWERLPIATTLSHCKWSGRACWFEIDPLPGGAFGERVCSIYPGTLVAAPHGEVLIAYGAAEYRSDVGVQYATRFARLEEGAQPLLDALARMHDEGDMPVTLSRA